MNSLYIRRLQKVGVNEVIRNVGMKSFPNLSCRSCITPAMIMANHLLFLLLSLYAMAAFAQVLVSIDCGSSSDVYTDKNGITWSGDDSYINTGENKVVQTGNSVSQEMKTLRVFSSNPMKNCYSINFTKGKKVLVRASFYYGNYDEKSSPPSFDLLVDGNHWTTVDTSTSEDVISKEVIYVSRKDAISVCLALRKHIHLPFISALEVISLDYKMYEHVDSSYALFLEKRIALGAKETIRYPDEKYGRKWIAVPPSAEGYIAVASDASEINTSDSLDDPPSSVLQNAWTTVNRPRIIFLETGLPKREVPVYIKWYFSEVTAEVYSTQQRRFTILIDGEPLGRPIVPLYGAITEEYIVNFSASSETNFTLISTYNSKLPPLINAMEVFRISDQPLTDIGTNSVDVEQLSLLQTQFDVLAGWSGDPCLPGAYKWDWVACSSDKIPRITALYLSRRGLSGVLPNFSSMDALRVIELYDNSLTGEFPRFLEDLPNLQELDLAENDFSGSVPTSMSENKKLKLWVSGNRRLCNSGSESCENSTPSIFGPSPDIPKKIELSSNQKLLHISESKYIEYSMSSSARTSCTSANLSTNNVKRSSKLLFWVIAAAFMAFMAIVYKNKGRFDSTQRDVVSFFSSLCKVVAGTFESKSKIFRSTFTVANILEHSSTVIVEMCLSTIFSSTFTYIAGVFQSMKFKGASLDFDNEKSRNSNNKSPDYSPQQLEDFDNKKSPNSNKKSPDSSPQQPEVSAESDENLMPSSSDELRDLGLIQDNTNTWKSITAPWIRVFLLISLFLNVFALWFLITSLKEQKLIWVHSSVSGTTFPT